MKVSRINRIKGHRGFTDFTWSSLDDFARFNLIYGWNGSGKTTLSNLFRHIEKREAILEGQIEFHIDGKPVLGNFLSVAPALPRVRVFNRDFIGASVGVSSSSLNPIFFLGTDSVEKQKVIEELKKQLLECTSNIATKEQAKRRADSGFDKFCIQSAKTVKELLQSGGQSTYNTYDKAAFAKACRVAAKHEAASAHLDDETKAQLKQQIRDTPKERIAALSVPIPNLQSLVQKCETHLLKTVLSQKLDELGSDSNLAEWVQAGLHHHNGPNTASHCRFCGSPMPADRLAKLEAHFNDAYKAFLNDIDSEVRTVAAALNSLKTISWPGKTEFRTHRAAAFVELKSRVESELQPLCSYLDWLKVALSDKRQRPFERVELSQTSGYLAAPDTSAVEEAVGNVQALIQEHNDAIAAFEQQVRTARERLEQSLVAEALDEFKALSEKKTTTEADLLKAETDKRELDTKIGLLEKEIVEHLRPADELNEELRNYLGRDDLTFTAKDTGYIITRHGQIATNLSEGERTAIAFLYFLKSLKDKNFTLATDIVVIDDPVSSLDASALFCAFGYLKTRTKDAGQLFILTHNFTFFRQVKNWFHHLRGPDKKEQRFYMVEATSANGKRNSILKPLDRLLREFESEYHYLFKMVYDESKKPAGQRALEEFYAIPNIARRLLEGFLAFRFPRETNNLHNQLERSSFDAAKRARLLRFLNTFSHDQTVGENGHDLSLLAETPMVLADLMDFLKAEDVGHFTEMEQLVNPNPPINN